MSVLTDIQNELKAPKSRYNKFGEYYYRSCEDILEAVKPLLKKYEASLTIRDEIIAVGNRVYVKAIVKFSCNDGEKEVTAFAREAEEKKKLDVSQITGVASSYARKYALNGLFLIDDTKDADTDEFTQQTRDRTQDVAGQKIGTVKGKALTQMLEKAGQDVRKFLAYYRVEHIEDLTEKQHLEIVTGLQQRGYGDNGKA